MYKICFIIPYFGRWPRFFDLFLESCGRNTDVDFLFFTDCGIPEKKYPNTIFHESTLENFNQLAAKNLELPIKLDRAFKLCDMKVTYGVVFKDYLQQYDFWGHCDADLIFGHIRKFISDDILTNYEVIFARSEYISGFFALYKNNAKINYLFRKSKDYQKVFSNNSHFSFGECNFAWTELKQGKNIRDLNTEIESMTHVVKRLMQDKKLKAYFKTMAYEAIPANWQRIVRKSDGSLKIDQTGEELLLFHFVSAKHSLKFIFPQWAKIPDCYFITDIGFFKENELKGRLFIRKKIVHKWNYLIKGFQKLKKKYTFVVNENKN